MELPLGGSAKTQRDKEIIVNRANVQSSIVQSFGRAPDFSALSTIPTQTLFYSSQEEGRACTESASQRK